jgi:putative transposase
VKYEEVNIKEYRSVGEAISGLGSYFELSNAERLHQSLGYQTPEEVYRQGQRMAAATTLN